MFLVGGGILVHGFGFLHHVVGVMLAQHGGPGVGQTLLSAVADGVTGVVAGALVYAVMTLWASVRRMWQLRA
jgi:predicted DNA repair protein MutK